MMQLQTEQAALQAASERAAIAGQAGQLALRQSEAEQKLLAQQRTKLENEQRVLAEIEMRVKTEAQASAALEEREAAEQHAREAAQIRAKLAQEVAQAVRQRTELEERESVQLRAQAEQLRADVDTLQATALQRRNRKIVRLAKGVGLVSAVAATVILSLSALQTQQSIIVPPTNSSQPIKGIQASANAAGAVQTELAEGPVKPQTYLLLDGLKMTDQLGQKELKE
jgi:hypothetical protein